MADDVTRAELMRAVEYGHKPEFDFGLTLSRTFSGFFGNIGPILLFGIVSSVAASLLALPVSYLETLIRPISGPDNNIVWSVLGGFWFLITLIAYGAFHAFCMIIAHHNFIGQPYKFMDVAMTSAKAALPLTLIGIIFFIAYCVGSLLLIIPGIILAVGWSILGPAYLFDNVGISWSFGRSWSFTNGFKGWVWLIILVMGVINFIIFNVIMTGSLVFMTPGFVSGDTGALSTANIIGPVVFANLALWIYFGLRSTMLAAIHVHCCELKEGGVGRMIPREEQRV